eukprot:TRINITY_DN457_c0_g1_i8.p1 TRINITY_DN457_c0_g1~~TRINITY_DN457_c0_g1_i8.p1  ORF type:complete len:103 (-),score=5.96 TRINITY_DN457_c0_g1_i8:285-593(-)
MAIVGCINTSRSFVSVATAYVNPISPRDHVYEFLGKKSNRKGYIMTIGVDKKYRRKGHGVTILRVLYILLPSYFKIENIAQTSAKWGQNSSLTCQNRQLSCH